MTFSDKLDAAVAGIHQAIRMLSEVDELLWQISVDLDAKEEK